MALAVGPRASQASDSGSPIAPPRGRRGRRHAGRFAYTALAAMAWLLVACSGSSPGDESPPPTQSAAATRPAAPSGSLPAGLERKLQKALDATMAEYEVPGAVVGVWVPDEGSWTSAAGLADIEGDTAASTDMTWPLRSITKSYTVTLLLQLVDEDKVSLEDTIDKYVDGVTNGDTITLRQLANMTSGNADYTGEAFFEAYSADPTRIFTLEELNGFMLEEPAQFEPGAEHVYTNANTNLLGAVVEEVTGRRFDDVLETRILEPLGQVDTRYLVDVDTWTKPRPSGYAPGEDGLEAQDQNLSIFGPAGSMVTTLDDARVWGETLATGSLLTPRTQAERLEGDSLDSGPPYDIYALGIGETNGWWGHNGEGLGFTAAIFHHPDSGATVAVFMNESNVEPKAHPADQAFRRFAEVLARR